MSSYSSKYAFLSQPPPPPQKKRPSHPPPPVPTRKRSSTFSAIASWAARVQPGSPGSPPSTRRLETPSPVDQNFAVDLTNLGYTSVFVHLTKTPNTPMHSIIKPIAPREQEAISKPVASPIKRLRSLSILSRKHSATLPTSPVKPTHEESQTHAASIALRKKASYLSVKSSKPKRPKVKPDLPPSLAVELALMQFVDGGSTEDNIKRLMEAQARAAAPAGTKPSTNPAVSDVYRDGKGGIWWDREEEMEYAHLLGGNNTSHIAGPEKWVSFSGEVKEGRDVDDNYPELALASLADGTYGRRDSANSVASATSSLDPCNIVKPAEDDAALVRVPLAPVSIPNVPALAPNPKTQRRPTPEPILTIPSRPRHGHHLRANPNFFLLDLNAFSVPATPRSPHTPHIPGTPRTPRTPIAPYPTTPAARQHTRSRSSPVHPTFTHQERRRGPARRRPAPLNIVAHVPMRGVSPEVDEDTAAGATVDNAKQDFLQASFAPKPASAADVSKAVPMHREPVQRGPVPIALAVSMDDERGLKKTSHALLSLFGRK
ncbi:hypothetical protein H0H92_003331 [Tricholoma furcatifolium]|nr:hypothetical protein H0H92_003331 [Tricholoma furcatifolium]